MLGEGLPGMRTDAKKLALVVFHAGPSLFLVGNNRLIEFWLLATGQPSRPDKSCRLRQDTRSQSHLPVLADSGGQVGTDPAGV